MSLFDLFFAILVGELGPRRSELIIGLSKVHSHPLGIAQYNKTNKQRLLIVYLTHPAMPCHAILFVSKTSHLLFSFRNIRHSLN